MSRTGKNPIPIPDKVKVNVADGKVSVEGPLGKLSQDLHEEIEVQVEDKQVTVNRKNDEPQSKALHGLMRSLIQNMVQGVSEGCKKELDIQGVGYRADVKGKVLNLSLGFSHPVEFPIPEGIQIKVDKQTHLIISGFDKVQVGQVASDIRKIRPPEPYKGKGVRYSDEVIIRKAGKAAAGGGAGK
ncbi:MAG: 50S ribosomal protein L6 [bacterium]|nr:50S ribosomal protein L6 [bacterium]